MGPEDAAPVLPADRRPQIEPAGLLLKVRGSSATGFAAGAEPLLRGGETVLELAVPADGMGMAPTAATWVRMPAGSSAWDEVHALARRAFGVAGDLLMAAEPDLLQSWPEDMPERRPGCVPDGQTGAGGQETGEGPGWHLEDSHSQLRAAARAVGAAARAVRIAHLDTGYDPAHRELPRHLLRGPEHERSFVRGEEGRRSAVDTTGRGIPGLANRGHGMGTLGILAGPSFGAIPEAEVLPVRVGEGVVRFSTASIARGFDWALAMGCQVLSMSMGGLASKLLADAVNKLYDAGVVMVTAAGNNFRRLPVGSIVYPARHARVVAACGVMARGTPYAFPPVTAMSGCHGPADKMETAVAGFTPNIPWPRIDCPETIDLDGGGTSSATPQVAAAAALWIARHRAALAALPERWMRGEAARQALFRAAAAAAGLARPDPRLGWGPVKAHDMLAHAPLSAPELRRLFQRPATASWDMLKLLTGRGLGLAGGHLPGEEMVELELAQLGHRVPELDALALDVLEAANARAREAAARAFLEAARDRPEASVALRRVLGLALDGVARPAPSVPPPLPPQLAAAARQPAAGTAGDRRRDARPRRRRLRIFARDPTLGGRLATFDDLVATVSVRNEPDLAPGPVGEYLEVVDIDPASDRAYPPVDLNDIDLALADGLMPSEGNPQSHQQMVYAVAMQVIEAFELALGRKALWAAPEAPARPSAETVDSEADIEIVPIDRVAPRPPARFCRRLRIHPHALRGRNAYYSPAKTAVLFGYFPADSRIGDITPPGTMVFTCLSSDVIAHEVTHALLDGQSAAFRDPSNRDVLAFHEGFADLVALFQQFTYRDLVRRAVARGRGTLDTSELVGALARQFGEGTGRAGPLRSYPELPGGQTYASATRVHDLGATLVAAVYRAFLAIADRRAAPLVRLATGGTGILGQGQLHPDLVEAITTEICQAALDVQKMCIRALDYLPPVDVTFGEYLRAIITADIDAWPEDENRYRIAFLEAFREAGMLPRDLRTVSCESLAWEPAPEADHPWLAGLAEEMRIKPGPDLDRAETQRIASQRRDVLERRLRLALAADEAGTLHRLLGLQPGLRRYANDGRLLKRQPEGTNFYVDDVRVKRREQATGEMRFDIIARVRQRRPEPLDPAAPAAGSFWFRGGATLVIDPFGSRTPIAPAAAGAVDDHTAHAHARLRFAIRKSMTSGRRLADERAFRTGRTAGDPRASYFGAPEDLARPMAGAEPFAFLHALRDRDG